MSHPLCHNVLLNKVARQPRFKRGERGSIYLTMELLAKPHCKNASRIHPHFATVRAMVLNPIPEVSEGQWPLPVFWTMLTSLPKSFRPLKILPLAGLWVLLALDWEGRDGMA